MAVDITTASAATSLVVGLIALALAGLAVRAWQRSGNRQLLFVSGAFALFLAKSLFSAYNVRSHFVRHDTIELIVSLFDLAILALLVMPFVLKR